MGKRETCNSNVSGMNNYQAYQKLYLNFIFVCCDLLVVVVLVVLLMVVVVMVMVVMVVVLCE